MMKRDDIIWLSGLLEGEGWFGLDHGKYPVISLKMTDEDIVVKVAAMWDVRVNCHKNYWMASIYGTNAIGWMITLYPLLGSRRKEKVASVIKFWREYTYSRASNGLRTMAKCHPDRVVHALGLCKQCYDKQCQKNKEEQLLKLVG